MLDTDELDRLIKRNIILLDDGDFKAELCAFRRSFQRLKIRLRNNHLIGQLKQLRKLIRQLELDYPIKLFLTFSESVDNFEGTKKQLKSFRTFQSFNCQLILEIDKILEKAIHAYCYTQPYFKVGHLIPHFVVLRASLARLTICFKALLVHASDMYMELSRFCPIDQTMDVKKVEGVNLLTCEDVRQILIKHNCKPRLERSEEAKTSDDDSKPVTEQIGQLIDRATMKPVSANKRK